MSNSFFSIHYQIRMIYKSIAGLVEFENFNGVTVENFNSKFHY